MSWEFLLVEAFAYGFGGYALRVAWQRGVRDVSILAVAMAFGLAVEFFFVTVFDGYSYGDFLIMPTIAGHSVPLWVAVGWGTIIYTAMRATDRLPIHWSARSMLDGLLAVSLDVSLDPIAEALGFWHWSREGQFYGVPYDNFIGWVMIVGSFSMFTRGAYHLLGPGSAWTSALRPLAALVPAVALVAGFQYVLEAIYPLIGEPLTFFLLAGLLLAISVPQVLRCRPTEPPRAIQILVPVGYHALFLVYLLGTGLYDREPTLLLLMPLAAFASFVGFTTPRRDLRRAVAEEREAA